MKIKIYTTVVLSLMFFFISCSEDTLDDSGFGTITGTVVEEGSNEPVENARISTNPSSSTVFTDEKGEFVLENVPAGEYSVEARKNSFLSQFEGASVMTNASVNVVFELEKETAGNKPPSAPVAVSPADNEKGLSIPVKLSWTSTDVDDDELTFALEIRNDKDEEILLVEDIEDTTYTVENLDYNTRYFWQVAASDGINSQVLSPLYAFRTMDVSSSRILFTRQIGGNNVIFAVDNDGNEFQLTSASTNSFRPRKNNATNRIAYLRTVAGETQLFTMNPDGSQKRQVTSAIPVRGFDLEQVDFSWANDGTSLLYPHFNKLYMINSNGGGTELIYEARGDEFITEVDVSEDDETIALITNNSSGYDADLFTINFSGEVQETILTNVTGALGGLDLSVRGDQLLYVHDASGFENDSYRRLDSRLFIYNFNTGLITDLSSEKEDGTNDLDPRFSPNEAQVIFVNTSNDEISPRNIFRLFIEDNNNGNNEDRVLVVENAAMPDWE